MSHSYSKVDQLLTSLLGKFILCSDLASFTFSEELFARFQLLIFTAASLVLVAQVKQRNQSGLSIYII